MFQVTLCSCFGYLRYPPVPHLCQLMEQAGLKVSSAYCLTYQSFMKLEVLLDKQGPFDPQWRNMNRYLDSLNNILCAWFTHKLYRMV